MDSDPRANPDDVEVPPSETSPLLKSDDWKPGRAFLWIELAIFANVFLCGFDGTITAATYGIISSDFDAANTASWLTTSYLVTTTAFQPLYGRFSDILGRRICFFVSTITFSAGCLGCAVAKDIITLNLSRALTGFGGGGLMTMATIINSDLIPFRQRGMWQAAQNATLGFGAIAGASFGGAIADQIGWRWCFLLQVPISAAALVLGWYVICNQPGLSSTTRSTKQIWEKIDFLGALVLVTALSAQLLGLSMGGNQLPWSSPWVIVSLTGSALLLVLFFVIESRTSAVPVIPLRLLGRPLSVVVQLTNLCAGISAYAYLFMLPLFFQVVLDDSATQAGARLAIPSLATPLGGLVAGYVMSRYGRLIMLVRIGAVCLAFGNALVTSLGASEPAWKYFVFTFPANLGQGIIYPATLFTNLATFDHDDHAVSASTTYLIRSMGTVWGVAITSAILQTTLNRRLPSALAEIGENEKAINLDRSEEAHADERRTQVIDEVRHSVTALRKLPPAVQGLVRGVYYDGIRYAFAASTAFATLAVLASLFANGRGLRSTSR